MANSKTPSLQELLDAGLHFGHQVKRWHPHMAPYIYGKRDNIHIIDLVKTKAQLDAAVDFLQEQAKAGKVVLFVGTKRQAQDMIVESAERVGMPYVAKRWIGGLITNWDQNKKNIDKVNNYDADRKAGRLSQFTKKEQLLLERKTTKSRQELGGVLALKRVPDILFVIDPKKEMNAVLEARIKGIPIVALCDTNTNPTMVDYPIPGNDDSLKSLRLVITTIADAIAAGQALGDTEVAKKAEVDVAQEEPIIANIDEVIETVVDEVEGVVAEEEEQEKQSEPEKLEDKPASSKSQSTAKKAEKKAAAKPKAPAKAAAKKATKKGKA